MSVINGTIMLLSSGGVNIAFQRGVSFGVDLNLDDATNKESAGWANHIKGMLNAKIDLDALFSASATPLMSAKDLMDYILNRKSLLVSILGLGYPIVGEADMSSLKFNAPLEQAMSLSGSLKVNGPLFVLSGAMANMITDPDAGGTDYDTTTVYGTSILSAINAAGAANIKSNTFAVTTGDVIKFITFLTKTSGEFPLVIILKSSDESAVSNQVSLVEGLNFITLTVTSTVTATLVLSNTSASNWKTSPIYLFKI